MTLTINKQIEFALIKDSENDRGLFAVVNQSDKLNNIIKEMRPDQTIEEFWDLYDDEEGLELFVRLSKANIPVKMTGWQSFD